MASTSLIPPWVARGCDHCSKSAVQAGVEKLKVCGGCFTVAALHLRSELFLLLLSST
jgi:hypothetical protein